MYRIEVAGCFSYPTAIRSWGNGIGIKSNASAAEIMPQGMGAFAAQGSRNRVWALCRGCHMESDVSTIDPEYVIDRLERIEPGLGPGARILRRRYGINGFRNDQSAIQGQMPLFVLQPREFYDVQAVCRLATQLCAENNGVPPVAIVPRGGGTGMCGGAVPVRPSIVLDMTYMDRCLINHVHDDYSYCWVGPGVTVGRLNDADVHGNYFFPGIPIGASDRATIGGVLSTNARGMYSMKYGSAGDCVSRLDVVLADGSFAEFGHHMLESTSGLNLAPLLIGAEGTLGIIVAAIIRLQRRPTSIKSLYFSFDNLSDAMWGCSMLRDASQEIAAIEVITADTIKLLGRAFPDAGLPKGKPMVWVEVHSMQYNENDIDVSWIDCLEDYGDEIGKQWTPPEDLNPWDMLNALPRVIAKLSDEGGPICFSPAVPVGELRKFLTDKIDRKAGELGRHKGTSIVARAGAGLVQVNLAVGPHPFWPRAQAEEFRQWALEEARRHSGIASGLYGIGSTMTDRYAIEKQRSIKIMRSIKQMLDPNGILNPGKVWDSPVPPPPSTIPSS